VNASEIGRAALARAWKETLMLRSNRFVVQSLERRCLMSGAAAIDGIGVLGDSYSDEYQFYAPDRSTARNWVEQLAEDSNARFGDFSLIDPAGPRNAGCEYNWALSGATSSDLITAGQALGAAAEAATGHIDLVTIFIGGNDFRDVFGVLATQGPAAAQAALMSAVPTVATNIAIAAGTILSPGVVAANPDVHVVLTTIPRLSYLPEVRAAVQAVPQIAPFVSAMDGAVGILNQQIHNIAAGSDRIAVADFAGLVGQLFAARKLKVGNVELNRDALFNPSNDPTFMVLADGIHPGTIVQGLLANLYVQTANHAFGTQLEPLSTHDILENAGLKNEPAGAQVASQTFSLAASASGQPTMDELMGAATVELGI
jgi:lysophospholipase L1-like esterase